MTTYTARTAACRSGQRTVALRTQWLLLQLHQLPRGGSQSTPSNAYNDDEDDDGGGGGGGDRRSGEDHRLPLRRPPPSSSQRQTPVPPAAKPSSTATAASTVASSLAQSSLSLAQRALLGAARQSSRAALHVARSKSVHLNELHGLWRLDQDVRSGTPTIPPCSLSLEILVDATPFTCRIRIQHPSLNPSSSEQPTTSWITTEGKFQPSTSRLSHAMLRWVDPITKLEYSAKIQRKLADPSVLKLRGNVYSRRTGRSSLSSSVSGIFGGSPSTTRELVGTFVARRRLRLDLDDDDGDDANEGLSDEEEEKDDDEEEEDEVDEGYESDDAEGTAEDNVNEDEF